MRQRTYKTIFIILLLGIYCFAFQGRRGLFEPDEGRYSAIALQMIKSNDWIHPRIHPEQEHWAKPPLTYWAIAGSILLFGKNEFAVRFPNALAFFITILICFYLGKIFVPKKPWSVALIFATFLFPVSESNGATTDYILMMWKTLAVFCFSVAYWQKSGRASIWLWFMWLFFGLAFLTKGPPGLLPLLSIILFLLLTRRHKESFSMRWLIGFGLMMLVGGSWYFIVIFQRHELLRYFLWDEVALRVFTPYHARHPEWYAIFYMYVPILVFGTLPWSYYTAEGLIHCVKEAKGKTRQILEKNNSQALFLVLWVIVPLTIFIISKSKLPLYLLPSFVPLGIITAKEFSERGILLYRFRYPIIIWCLLMLFVRLIAAVAWDSKEDMSKFAKDIKENYPYPFDEIVVVNSPPLLGLEFYTGADVEPMRLQFKDLKEEFKEKESRLWLIRKMDEEKFHQYIKRFNVGMKEIGPLKKFPMYIVFKEKEQSQVK